MLEPSLSRAAYVERAVWEAERERVFAQSWVCVGRHDDVGDAPGSYRLVDLQGEHVLVVRGDDLLLRAFVNVCRHRGAELVDSTAPDATKGCFGAVIRCPYHHWTYDTAGSLRRAPHVPDLDRSDHGLLQLELGSWGGFTFVREEPGGPSLADELAGVVAHLANYPLAELVVGHRITYEVGANWKVLAENYNECYHCGPVHPELCDLVPSFRRGGGNELDWERGIPHRDGAYTFTTSGTTTRQPFPGLSADELVNHKGGLVYPNLLVSLSSDHVASFVLFPRGPAETTVVCDFLFHPDEVARAGFDPSDAVELWDLVNRQDWAICERVQRGMSSRHFTSGLYAPMEDPSLDIRRWWTARMHVGAD
ncbi:MAG: aromatic ring-hydroxylating dioxygenase subunit alpha [Acidimicrobiia bacterium]